MDAHRHRGDRVLRDNEALGETGDQAETSTVHDAPLLVCSVLELLFVVGLY